MAFYQEGNALVYQYDAETLRTRDLVCPGGGEQPAGAGQQGGPHAPSGIGP